MAPNTKTDSLLRLFTSGPEASHAAFDASLPSPPTSNTSGSSVAAVMRNDSGTSSASFHSKLNPESAVWTPPGWGGFPSSASKVSQAKNLSTRSSQP